MAEALLAKMAPFLGDGKMTSASEVVQLFRELGFDEAEAEILLRELGVSAGEENVNMELLLTRLFEEKPGHLSTASGVAVLGADVRNSWQMMRPGGAPIEVLVVDGEQRDRKKVDVEQGTAIELAPKETLGEAFEAKLQAYGNRPCLGWRVNGRYEWMSYGKFFERSRQLGKALSSKLEPGALVGICGANSLAWFTADFACLWAGLGTIPISEAWSPQTLQLVLDKCEAQAVLCDTDYLPKLQTIGCNLWLISLDEVEGATCPSPGKAISKIEDLMSRPGWPDKPVMTRAPDAIHTILHTSGTTGVPKGVVYSDHLWLSNMVSYLGLNVGYSYMPLAFITDRHTVCTNFWNGGRVGIRTPGDTDEIFKDLTQVQPTVIKGVPAFFEKVRAACQYVQDRSLSLLGGRCKLLICGAGALDEATAEWFRTCKVSGQHVRFLEMYGGTECGNIAVNRKLSPQVEYRLRPFGDMEITKGEDGKDQGEGELLVKTGASMFSCYYKDPERTKAAFTEDGFYIIGDLVSISGDRIDVRGRAKTSIKLGNGKWVLPESLEGMYRAELSQNGVRHIFIHGDSHHEYLVAVIDAEEYVNVERLLPKLHQIAVEKGKALHEHVAATVPSYKPFSRETRTLNGTGKLDRKVLLKVYRSAIDQKMQWLDEQAANESLRTLDPSKSFKAQGGTSLQASHLASLYLKLGLPISRAAQLLLEDAVAVKTIQDELMNASAEADAQWKLSDGVTVTDRSDDDAILLTGATGFLGRFVLAELLLAGRKVVCLARDRTEADARKRLSQALAEIGRWQDAWWPWLLIHLSSLQSPLKLSEYRISIVIHLAAVINLKVGYKYHRSANVLGTYHVLDFAAKVGARLIFASTTDTYLTSEQAITCMAEPVPEVLSDTKHGYAQSKAVSEAHVAAAMKQGLSACTVRVGMIAGDTQTGFCIPTDFAVRLLIGFAHCQAFPITEDKHTMVHSVPVDVAAAALVDISNSSVVGAVNLVSGAPLVRLSQLREQLLRFGGQFAELPLLPFPSWMARAKAEAQLSVWKILDWAESQPEFPVFNGRLPSLSADWARPSTLQRLILGVDEACLHKMLRYTFVSGEISDSKRKVRKVALAALASVKMRHF